MSDMSSVGLTTVLSRPAFPYRMQLRAVHAELLLAAPVGQIDRLRLVEIGDRIGGPGRDGWL
jgi:hypothetical protein